MKKEIIGRMSIIIILTIALVLGIGMPIASASSLLEYEQIVSIVDAIQIDGTKVFTDGEELDYDSLPKDTPYYPYIGAMFAWIPEENRGILQVYDNIYLSNYHQWNCADIAQARVVSEALVVAIPEYVYDMGGVITFTIATEDDIYTPSVFYEYDPTDCSTSYAKHYTKAEEFCAAVQTALDSISSEGDSAIPDIAKDSGLILSKGSKGKEVVRLQNRLNELGYSVGNADGDFGSKTESALIDFQENNGLPGTGITDAQTLKMLYSSDNVRPVLTPKPTSTPAPKPTNTPKPTMNSRDAALRDLMEASNALDANGDGYLSMDEVFNFG